MVAEPPPEPKIEFLNGDMVNTVWYLWFENLYTQINENSTSGGGVVLVDETFETVSKNLKSWDYTLNYTGGDLTSIVYTNGTDAITKTLNYTSGTLTSIVLSGDTPSGIDLTKTLSYTGGNLTGIGYS